MVVKCVVCGCDTEQKSSKGRLYCSMHCFHFQKRHHVRSEEWCKEELERRQQAYLEFLTGEELERHNKKVSVDTKKYYMRKPGLDKVRVCHDCGKPCSDYRCAGCWAKLRGVSTMIKPSETPTETEWDYF